MRDLLQKKRLVWSMVLLFVTGVTIFSYLSGRRYLATVDAVERTLAVQSAVDEILSLMKDAETGSRGYAMTGQDAFLEPYAAALAGVPRSLSALERTVHDDPSQRQTAALLRLQVAQKLDFVTETIGVRRASGASAAISRVSTGRGKHAMDLVRATCAQMRDYEQIRLESRRREADAALQMTAWGVGAGMLAMVMLALFSWLTVHRDVQALQRTAEELAESEEHYRLLTENSTDLVRLLDPSGRATYASPSVERLLGFGVDEFLALPARSLLHPDEAGRAAEILQEVSDGLASGTHTYRLRHKAGAYRYFEVRWTAQRDTHGKVKSIHTVGRDVTQRLEAEQLLSAQAEQLRSLSLRDELTQLYNRRGFLEVAGRMHVQAIEDERASAVVFVDLNGMKSINDEMGHEAGDEAIRDTAKVLSLALGSSATLARLGGDEFVVYALDFLPQDLDALRRQIREIADEVTEDNDRPYRLSLSAGGAFSTPSTPLRLDELLEQADAAMYEQKRARQAAGGISVLPPPDAG